jgi:hypothetical protein
MYLKSIIKKKFFNCLNIFIEKELQKKNFIIIKFKKKIILKNIKKNKEKI